MPRTYIYGVPKGFNLYEADPEMINYFQSYYIADRRGRWLEINRRDNGETFYNYIQYGLAEVERTPQNSFFGMTLVLDEGHYITNLHRLLQLMDLLFKHLVEGKIVMDYDSNGVLRYKVDRFDRVDDEMKWLKSNLPIVLDNVETAVYNESFTKGKPGLVATFKERTSTDKVLDTLRKFNWVSIRDNISENVGIMAESEVEFRLTDMVSWFHSTNQKLLPIALNHNVMIRPQLIEWRDTANDYIEAISGQMSRVKGNEEYTNLSSLKKNLADLHGQLEQLIDDSKSQKTVPPVQQQHLRTCFYCKRQLPLSKYSSPTAVECLDCEGKHTEQDNFEQKKVSHGSEKNNLNSRPHHHRPFRFSRWSKAILGAFIAIVIAVMWYVLIPKSSDPEETKNPQMGKVNVAKLRKALKEEKFDEVASLLKDRYDKDTYKEEVKDAIVSYMWSWATGSNKVHNIISFWSEGNKNLLLELNLYDQKDVKKEEWENFADDYPKINSTLKGEDPIEKDRYEELCKLIDNNLNVINEKDTTIAKKWKEKLKTLIIKEKGNKQQKERKVATQYCVFYTNNSGSPDTTIIDFTKNPNYNSVNDIKENTTVRIKALNGVFGEGNNKGKVTTEITVGRADGSSIPPLKCSSQYYIYLKVSLPRI